MALLQIHLAIYIHTIKQFSHIKRSYSSLDRWKENLPQPEKY